MPSVLSTADHGSPSFLVLLMNAAVLVAVAPAMVVAQKVTLWQFGAPRLDGGALTLPLIPQGTTTDANGGLATTFLYQVVKNQATVVQVNGLVTTQTVAVTDSRTIVASASGWIEPFNPGFIECGFVGPGTTFGECSNANSVTTTLANSGAPTPEVLAVTTPAVSTTAKTSSTTPSVTFGSTPSATDASSSSSSSSSSVSAGPIAGGIIGGLIALALVVFLFIFCRRRARRRQQADFETAPNAYPSMSSVDFAAAATHANGNAYRATGGARPSFSTSALSPTPALSPQSPPDTFHSGHHQPLARGDSDYGGSRSFSSGSASASASASGAADLGSEAPGSWSEPAPPGHWQRLALSRPPARTSSRSRSPPAPTPTPFAGGGGAKRRDAKAESHTGTQSTNPSELSTAELALALYRRVHGEAAAPVPEAPPPVYTPAT